MTERLEQEPSVPLSRPDRLGQIDDMSVPIFDFSRLTPAERIELAEQLWDSIEPAPGPVDDALAADLRRRRAEMAADRNLGEPGQQVLDEIADRGQ